MRRAHRRRASIAARDSIRSKSSLQRLPAFRRFESRRLYLESSVEDSSESTPGERIQDAIPSPIRSELLSFVFVLFGSKTRCLSEV
jgi:hypothetical protein